MDTWAVDYVLLGKNGERICPAVAYRDSRTETVPDELEKTVPFAWLYGRTGIQMQKVQHGVSAGGAEKRNAGCI